MDPHAVRFASLGDTVLPAVGTVVTLTSIEIASGTNTQGAPRPEDSLYPVITNGDGNLVAFSDSVGATVSKTKETYWSGEWQYSRDFTTWSSFVAQDGSNTISLIVGDQYKIFFMDGDQLTALENAIKLSEGEPVPVTSEYYKAAVRYSSAGAYSIGSSMEYGHVDVNGNTTSNANAPMMAVTVAYSEVPEPTTGTLSLLALAGLCIRRRK